jgi:HK97 family phage prohead protease
LRSRRRDEMLEHKAARVEIKEVGPKGEFAGWGAILDSEDDGGDTIKPGSMRKWLRSRTPKIYLEHTTSVGVYDVAEERQKGLWVEGQPDESRDGLDARAKVISGALDALSIGYVTKKAKETGRFKRDLLEIEVHHVGLVAFGMHPGAVVTSVKQLDLERITTVRDLERILRDAGFSHKAARTFCSPSYIASLAQGDPVEGAAEVVEAIKASTRKLQSQRR